MPLALTVPPLADQLIPGFSEPLTLAVNCCVLPVCTEAEPGATLTFTDELWLAALPVSVQPARERAMMDTIATTNIFARTCRGRR